MLQHFNRSLLLDMLTYRRPHGSKTEQTFRERFVLSLPTATEDAFGNIHVYVGDDPTVLWSCHTDTVHNTEGRQSVYYDPVSTVARLSRKARKRYNCLGADDTVGVFICRSLILADVPGHYVFHYAEEIGGIGSSNLASRCPELISDSKYAIALDRRGTGDIISHQFGGRCCSEAFIDSLASELAKSGMAYSANHGTFTDTANYTDIVGECTNLSIGYMAEHSRNEYVTLAHVESLIYALAHVDQSLLVSARRPGEPDEDMIRYYTQPFVIDRVASPIPSFVDEIKDCEYCGKAFFYENSDAKEFDTYCCLNCEVADCRETMRRLNGTLYLTSETADVQDTLIADFKRRTAGKVH